MIDLLTNLLPWVMSAMLIAKALLLGNKVSWAWLFAIALQGVWFCWALMSQDWGFIPATVVLFFINVRNHLKWVKEARNADSSRD